MAIEYSCQLNVQITIAMAKPYIVSSFKQKMHRMVKESNIHLFNDRITIEIAKSYSASSSAKNLHAKLRFMQRFNHALNKKMNYCDTKLI